MNYTGSSRRLLGNSRAAIMAAIEIYNKPAFRYRNECFVILLLNAWELLLKALLSKHKMSVFYYKRRNEPYRTLSWHDALGRAEKHFPSAVNPLPVRRNLELLGTYRDNAVHFYNIQGFGILIYALAQTSITNFRDIMDQAFGEKLEDEITWQLLPLGIKPPIDPVSYMARFVPEKKKGDKAVGQFIMELATAVKDVEAANQDSGRLLTIFQVKLESTKKIERADLVVGVERASETTGPLAIIRTQDPNTSHPLRQKDVIARVGTIHGQTMTAFVFQAIAWKHNIRDKPQFCWRAKEGILTRYSNDVMPFIHSLTEADLKAALTDYRSQLRSRSKRKGAKA